MTGLTLAVAGAGGFWNIGLWNTLTEPLLWQTTLAFSTPLILAAIGGTISERSGVVNVAMEGMMLVACFFSAYAADKTASLAHFSPAEAALAGVVAAILSGSLLAWLHAWACIRFQANQVVSGMAINLLALGLTSYLYFTLYGSEGTPGNLAGIPNMNIPVLGGIKFLSLGPILFQQNPITYIAFATLIVAHYFLFRTTLGIRIRSVG